MKSASQSLPWLIQLIQKNEGSLSVLPIQCLCEFMLFQIEMQANNEEDEFFDQSSQNSAAMSNVRNLLFVKYVNDAIMRYFWQLFNETRISELKLRLKNVLWAPETNGESFRETAIYFIRRLQAETAANRRIASKVGLCFKFPFKQTVLFYFHVHIFQKK